LTRVLDLWPWKSIGFQILLRTKYVPSLVKIHWRMLILECSQGCYAVKIWLGDLDLWPWKSIGFQILLRTKYVPSLVKTHWRMLILECSQGCYGRKRYYIPSQLCWRGDNEGRELTFWCNIYFTNFNVKWIKHKIDKYKINNNNTSTKHEFKLNMKDINKILEKAHFKCKFVLNDVKKQHIFTETCLYEAVGSLPVSLQVWRALWIINIKGQVNWNLYVTRMRHTKYNCI
jgi:hypothetical protein